jgi:KDO2-lipid IV(A) lauroyltransferase
MKRRSKVTDFLVYCVVRFVVCVVQALSYRVACRFADFLAWLAYHVDRRHQLVADDNLKHAFGSQLTPGQRDRLVRGIYRHFCRFVVEMVHLPRRLSVATWKDHLELVGGERIVGALLADRPLMLVTGHFGNWEMAGYALGLFGFSTYAIARRIDNPYLDRFLATFRQRTGQTILDKNDDYGRIQKVLADGGVMATLSDQDAGRRGLYVDFFGRPASTHKAIALLSLEYNVPLLVVGTPKVGEPMRYQIVAEDLILPEEYAGRADAVRAITQRFTTALERLVRRHPEQYFWLHRRWKHQPQPRKAKRVA